MKRNHQTRIFLSKTTGIAVLLAGFLLAARLCLGAPGNPSQAPNIFKPASTPAYSIVHLSFFVLAITGAIFLVVFSLIVYCVTKYRRRGGEDGREPAQVYGSNQVELAWTVIPVLIVLVLFLAGYGSCTSRSIRSGLLCGSVRAWRRLSVLQHTVCASPFYCPSTSVALRFHLLSAGAVSFASVGQAMIWKNDGKSWKE